MRGRGEGKAGGGSAGVVRWFGFKNILKQTVEV